MRFTFLFFLSITLFSCSVTTQFSKKADAILLKDTAIMHGNIGISIYEPATNKYLYRHNAENYFIPASNTKLFTLYAGMKYLGDSLVGLRIKPNSSIHLVFPTGDPTFLHPDFKKQPVWDYLKKIGFINFDKHEINNIWRSEAWGNGWAWNDYNDDYMVERSPMPIYGNLINFSLINDSLEIDTHEGTTNINVTPVIYQNKIRFNSKIDDSKQFSLKRNINDNIFFITNSNSIFHDQSIPLITNGIYSTVHILNDLLYDFKYDEEKKSDSLNIIKYKNEHKDYISVLKPKGKSDTVRIVNAYYGIFLKESTDTTGSIIIYSQPTDSLFKPMMHRSDNFFAEQTLLMASNEHIGYMSDEDMIDTLLKTDLKDIPQRPKWVDGSGLSRYNLFTPNDFVYILGKIKNEFGFDRIKNILATGGEGTLKYYFKKEAGFIYAKTGTLSNNCALSGYLITKKNKLLIFSVLTNNYITGATPIRRAVEKYIEFIRENY
ncbi:MAG: D-alanyl-D-alanine carboxypeptidase [Ferruginibacter sp.]